jgi:hypothetical protein
VLGGSIGSGGWWCCGGYGAPNQGLLKNSLRARLSAAEEQG